MEMRRGALAGRILARAFKILTKSRPRDMPLGNRGLGDDNDQTDTTDAFWSGTAALTAAGIVPLRRRSRPRAPIMRLLVACTDYPNLPQKNWLIGPKNDAALVRDYLLSNCRAGQVRAREHHAARRRRRGRQRARRPTRRSLPRSPILPARSSATTSSICICPATARSSRRPRPATRPTGSTRSSCRTTSSKWVNRDKGVPNALIDDEIGAALDAIRDKGAFVWAVFDCCHSGTATRGADGRRERAQGRGQPDLGIPRRAKMSRPARHGSRSHRRGRPSAWPAFNLTPTGAEPITKGKLVAFYAAQTIETTPEMPLPKGTSGRRALRPVHLHHLLQARREP